MSILRQSVHKLAQETQGPTKQSLLLLLKQSSIDSDFEDAMQETMEAAHTLKSAANSLVDPTIKAKCRKVYDLMNEINELWAKL